MPTKNYQYFCLLVLWSNVCDKEYLAVRNNFRVTEKFLITKFDCIMINSIWIWFLLEETIQINWFYSSLFYRLWRAKVWRCVTLFGCGKCRTIGCERSFRFKFKPTKFFEVCTEFRPNLIFHLGVLEIKVWVGVWSAT